jgi:O-antigen/teichoic acid export membrane protein
VQLLLLAVMAYLAVDDVQTVVTLYALVYLIPLVAIETAAKPVWSLLRAADRPSRTEFRKLSRFAAPALIAGLAYGGILGLDVVLVRVLASDQLATYGAARALALPMTMIPLALGVVLLPRVAATSEGERWHLLVKAMAVTTLLSLIVGVAYFLLGGFALEVVYPASYRGATTTLHALVPGLGLLGLYVVLSQWCLGAGFPKLPAWSLSLGALTASVADAFLIPRYGAPGAGIGMTIGMVVAIAVLGRLLVHRAKHRSLRWDGATPAGALLRSQTG